MTAQLLGERPELSASKVAGWRLWTLVVAGVIHAFEVILDLFRAEVDEKTSKITPGTLTWYQQMCLRFQNGYELKFDTKTAELYYDKDDPDAQIIKVAAITEGRNSILLKVAKFDQDGRVTPLDIYELKNFTDYVEAIKFAGLQVDILSIPSDLIRYDIEVYYDPAVPAATVEQNVRQALDDFRVPKSYDAMFYPQRMIEAVLSASGVITAKLNGVQQKKATEEYMEPVGVMAVLWAGFFEYADDCVLTMISAKNNNNESED